MKKIRVAIAGVGNCASSLVQGIHFYRDAGIGEAADGIGLLHRDVGGYGAGDIDLVAAIDIDARKVGKPLHEAIVAPPNNTKIFYDRFRCDDVRVVMGNVLDGVADHMGDYPETQRFVVADAPGATRDQIIELFRRSGAEILMNYLPVGSQKATEFYAHCCLAAGVSLINCIPVFIVSEPAWARRFTEAGIPCIGDDVKAQVGATIVHRVLARLFRDRGAEIDATYQLNTGGNTDFLNMLNQRRLGSKRISKTEAVQSQLDVPLPADQVHIGPSDYVPWQKDNKICFCRIEGRGFGGVPLHVELRLSVDDSPNSAGETIDAIRCCKLARDRGLGGPLKEVSAYTMKHPPLQFPDYEALRLMEDFIAGNGHITVDDGSYQPARDAKQHAAR